MTSSQSQSQSQSRSRSRSRSRFRWLHAWLLLATIVVVGSARADDYSRYVDGDDMPNPVAYLPEPPDSTMIMRNGDYARWIWGKTVRNTPRGEQASGDSKYGILRTSVIFSDILGLNITEEGTPAIYRFMARAGETGAGGVSAMKHARFRKRPFLLMDEPTWGAHDSYEELERNSSYPSSHTACGWGTALALAEMAPHLQDTILRRGYDYGMSRVIVGAHWQSDVDAAMLCASAAIARSRLTAEYQADLAAARMEYMQLKGLDESQINTTVAPSAQKILYPPVMDDSHLFYGDVASYWHAKGERNSERGAQAIMDASLGDDDIIAAFAACTGVDLSSFPNVVALIKSVKTMLGTQALSMKNYWYRKRPYVRQGDPTLLPAQEEAYSGESSFPSRHAMIGWGLALVLAEVMPDCQDAILKRGYDYGWSRVIAGYLYPTDVQAGRVMACCLVTKAHNDPSFNAMLEAAKQEYAEAKGHEGFLATMMAAQQLSFLPQPPDSVGLGFAGDFYRWVWGKNERGGENGELARHDSECGLDALCHIFGDVLGVDISQSSTPEIYNFIAHAASAGASRAGEMGGGHFRKRPFVLMNEQPWGDHDSQPALSDSTSHPLAHAAMTWTAALAMAQLAPNMQDSILTRAMRCASSGVITGACWQSDVDAAMLVSGEVISQLWASGDYATLFANARNEYLQVTGLSEASLKASFPKLDILIDAPPSKDDVFFASDAELYWYSKQFRDSERGALAQSDASLSNNYLVESFAACSPVVEISEANTPSIVMFVEALHIILNSRATTLKRNSEFRGRPYVVLERHFTPNAEERDLYFDPSYPSRHAMIGWGLAMALAEVMPDCHLAILERGDEYCNSRMITGMCFDSDIRAAKIMAMCDLAKLHNEEIFISLLNSAKGEYRLLRNRGDVNGDGLVSSVDITALYNYLLNGDDSHIVNGDQDGDGTITSADIIIVYNLLLSSL